MKILKNELNNIRIDSAILETLQNPDLTRSKIQKMIENSLILVNSKPENASYKIKTGDNIKILEKETEDIEIKPQNIPLDIIFEDDYLIVINKQKGILTHPTPLNKENSLVNAPLFTG